MNHVAPLSPLDTALLPLRDFLASGEDVAVNEPGVVWWLHDGRWTRHEVPEMTYLRIRGIAVQAIAKNRPKTRETFISTDIPVGGVDYRLEAVLEPAVLPGTAALCFRRADALVSPVTAITSRYDTARWNQWRGRRSRKAAESEHLLALYDQGDIAGFLAAFALARRTPLFGGATGAGKTYMLKTYLGLLPSEVRVVVIEDAKEAVITQPNHLRLIFQAGGVTPAQCLASSLRLRPDYVPLQELRNPAAAWVWLNEVVSGHPGSPSTIHGSTPQEIARRLFNLAKGSPEGGSIGDETLIDMLSAAIDLIVPIRNDGGVRSIGEIWFADEAARHGDTFADLLKDG